MKKFISYLLSVTMLAASSAALAAAPSAYDAQPYPTGVSTSDPDGQMDLAVIANGDVKIYGDAMYIEGSVYSNGTIYGGNGAGNVIKGAFISGTENQTEKGVGDLEVVRYGYVHVDDDGNTDVTNAYSTGLEHEGAILDKDTSFDYSYTPYEYPEIANYIEYATANRWRSVFTVSEDAHIGTLDDVSEAGFIIDATEKDITIVIDTLNVSSNPYIQVCGDHHVNLYVKNWVQNGGDIVNLGLAKGDINNSWDGIDQWAYNQNHIFVTDSNGIPRPNETLINEMNPDQIDFYVNTESGVVNFQGARVAANIHSNAAVLTFGMNLEVYGNVESGAKEFETIGSGYINGNVSVPNAASTIHNSSCINGQLITDTLLINGAGSILKGTDSLNVAEKPGETNAPEDDKNIHLSIIEDVVYVVIGDGTKPQFTLDKNTNYKWTIDDTSKVWYSTNSLNENEWYPGYFTADDVTFDYNQWGAIQPGDEVVIKATSVDDENVFDTAKIIFVASADDIPKEEPKPTSTPAPLPDGDEVDLKGAGYAYIFGYEPEISYVYDEEKGEGKHVARVYMAPDDAVTREQVAAMIMRMVDQKYDTMNVQYPVTSNIAAHAGTWYERGLAYLAEKGTFDGIDAVETGAVTRGEVSKLVAFGLNLSQTTDVAFTDIDGNEYAEYIKMMVAANYMDGMSATEFAPNKVMTRAEFCQMFNNIIDRNSMGLAAKDGTVVTPEIYSIVDISGHWAEDVMLKATSVYDEDGYVDIETRLANIRNVLDNYDSQKWY